MFRTLVLGNGESRSNLNLKVLQNQFTIVGCNAVFREIQIPHLVCCDRRMIEEASTIIDPSITKLYTRKKWVSMIKNIDMHELPILPYEGDQRQDQEENWNSGPYAVLLASLLEAKDIVLVGFDLYSTNGKVNNIYKGTKNYHDSSSLPVNPSYWIYQISKIFESFPDKKYIVVNDDSWRLPSSWKKKNTELRNIQDFYIDNKYLSSIIVQ